MGPLLAWRSSQTYLAVILSLLLAAPPAADAKKPDKKSAKTMDDKRRQQDLDVFVLQGNGAFNFIPDGKGLTAVVEVRDSNKIPIEGAEVVFELPESGPGGLFPDGKRTKTLKTNTEGQVGAAFNINAVVGSFEIKVSATAGDRKGSAIISQSNSMTIRDASTKNKRPLYKNWKVIAGVAAAVGLTVGIVLATRGGASSTTAATTPTVIITPGGPTIGGPR